MGTPRTTTRSHRQGPAEHCLWCSVKLHPRTRVHDLCRRCSDRAFDIYMSGRRSGRKKEPDEGRADRQQTATQRIRIDDIH